MLSPGVGIILRSLDPDAARMCNVGGIVDSTIRRALSAMAKDLKGNGVFPRFALYPFAGGTSQAHAQNLAAGGAYPITWVNSPTHDANGVTFNGTTNYGRCVGTAGIFPANMGMSVYVKTVSAVPAGTQIKSLIGFGTSATNYYNINRAKFGAIQYNRGCMGPVASMANDADGTPERTGLLSINRTSSIVFKGYDDGVEYLSNSVSESASPPSWDCFIGAQNESEVLNAPWDGKLALAALHDGHTAAQSLVFSQIVTAFQTKLGRNV